MKFSVGYQQNEPFIAEILRCRADIHEVYFAWDGIPNGRNTAPVDGDISPWEHLAQTERDLARIAQSGISLNLLLNATCYGRDSQSRAFFAQIGTTLGYLCDKYALASVTTTSPLLAKFCKQNFPQLEVRASVNMEIGTAEGMEYIAEWFDGYYMRRELNRDFTAIEALKKWCDANDKHLYALANSGCLNNCSAHVFHDNLVSHEREIAQMDNGYAFEGVCRRYIPTHRDCLLTNTNFIRPEDIALYAAYFPVMKLATRVTPNPLKILHAYINGGCGGSTLDLLEPNHSGLLYPYVLENKKITSTVENGILTYRNFENALIKLEGDLC